eukprot:scaffold1143_cov96-Cylindrotheca_fusiformis.AAC.4
MMMGTKEEVAVELEVYLDSRLFPRQTLFHWNTRDGVALLEKRSFLVLLVHIYWRSSSKVLSRLYEQKKLPRKRRMLPRAIAIENCYARACCAVQSKSLVGRFRRDLLLALQFPWRRYSLPRVSPVSLTSGLGFLRERKYRITKRVGGGSFGDIYLGVGANGEKVAVKFEKHGARCPQLRHEYKVYRELQNAPGFAKVHYFGTQDSYNLMVMDLLGPSLEDQFNKCGRRFSLKTVLMVADQLLERVELMHSRHLIHRDIKPANFVTDGGRGNGNFIYCIDFGLSKRYRHPRTLQHIPQREGRSLTGTPRYASINNHLGVEQSRRDDLESIGYVLVYFLKGGLPWQGLKAKSATKKYKLIMEKKQSITIPALCQGCPSQFAEYLAYCRSLKFEAKPNIAYLRGMFRDLFRSQGYTNNHSSLDWDWNRHEGGDGRERMEGAGMEDAGRY